MSDRDLEQLRRLIERTLGREWVDLAEWIRSLPENQLAALEARIAAGQIGEVVAGIDQAALRFAAETQAAYERAARQSSRWLDEQPGLESRLIRFDAADERVVARARANQLELVEGFRLEANRISRQITQRAISEGATTGVNPRRVAEDFRESIGLTSSQERWVANTRRALEAGDYGNVLGRRLVDGRSRRKIERVARDGGNLSREEIDRVVEQYRRNAIAYRAETIARTESQKNIEQGRTDAFDQAIRRGDVEADQLVKEWIAGPPTDDARDDHQAMDGKRVKWGEAFVLPDGTRMQHPGDPAGGAKHNANCRCTMSTTIDLDAAAERLRREEERARARPVVPTAPSPTPSAEAAPAPTAPPKNPRRQAAARAAAAASVERRREIHSAARSNLPPELQGVWDKEGYKFMREEAKRIRGVKDRVNASSTLSQAFAEKYGSGEETVFGNEGDRYQRRAEIEANNAIEWANEQERRYYAEAERAAREGRLEEFMGTPTNADDDDPPF